MSSRFYFGDSASDTSDTDLNDASSLPFPTPLTRTAFLQPTFDATAYLSALTASPRFQTLSDLHAELKALSAHLTAELVDLVNADYEQFLSLGASLRGGEEKVEEVRVGLMGFQRDVEGVRSFVEERGRAVQGLMAELRAVRRQRNVGRGLLEVERRMGELEDKLGVRKSAVNSQPDAPHTIPIPKDTDDEWADWDLTSQPLNSDSEDTDDDAEAGAIPRSLTRRIDEYSIIRVLSGKLGPEHPFLLGQRDRLFKIRAALLAKLEGEMRRAQDDEVRRQIIRLRLSLDQEIPRKGS